MSFNPNAPAFRPSFLPPQQVAPPQYNAYVPPPAGGYANPMMQQPYPTSYMAPPGADQQTFYPNSGYPSYAANNYYPPNQQYQNQPQYTNNNIPASYSNPTFAPQVMQRPQAPPASVQEQNKPNTNTATVPIVTPAASGEKKKASTLVIGKKKEEPTITAAAALPQPTEQTVAPSSTETAKAGSPEGTATTTTNNSTSASPPTANKEKPKKPMKEYSRDPRPHVNIVFCGHVDAGKSTISGHIMYLTGNVDERTMEKNKRDAIQRNRDGWEFAYLMDLTEEERDRGKTHETGSAYFVTEKKRYTILDAPGHKCFVASMIGGASQADVAILVISSRKGEFETGFESNGQTREHALLLKTCGCKKLVIAVNKLDDPSVNWDVARWEEIRDKLNPFLRTVGYVEKKNMVYIPISGLKGYGIKDRIPADVCSFYDGPSLLEYLDSLTDAPRDLEANVRFPIQGRYREDGKVVVYGKLETGQFVKGDTLLLVPSKKEITIESAQLGECDVEISLPGDFLHVKVRGVEEEDIHAGDVLCFVSQPLKSVWYFQAQIVISDTPIMSVGYNCMMHVHAAECEVNVDKILAKVDKKTNKVIEKNPAFARNGESIIARIELLTKPVVMEVYKDYEHMGRFNLRVEGKTVAFGVVTKLYETQKTANGEGTTVMTCA